MKTRPRLRFRRGSLQPEADFDGAWKEAIKLHLQVFLRKCFPAIASRVNWSIAPEWLDKELSRVIGRSKARARVVDLLVRLTLISGDTVSLLLHVEVQSSYEAELLKRLVQYNGGLNYVLGEPVVTLLILADLNVDWMPTEHCFEFEDFRTHHRFPVCKLARLIETDWRDDWSLPAILARAQLESLRTRDDPEARKAAKWRLIRQLFNLGLNAEEIQSIYNFIDWMMRLRPDLEAELSNQVVLLEQEQYMPHITSMERRGIEIGRAEGIIEGKLDVLTRQISRFGKPSVTVKKQLEALTTDQIDDLSVEIFDISSMAELRDWLRRHQS